MSPHDQRPFTYGDTNTSHGQHLSSDDEVGLRHSRHDLDALTEDYQGMLLIQSNWLTNFWFKWRVEIKGHTLLLYPQPLFFYSNRNQKPKVYDLSPSRCIVSITSYKMRSLGRQLYGIRLKGMIGESTELVLRSCKSSESNESVDDINLWRAHFLKANEAHV